MKAVLTYHSLDDSGSPISLTPRVFDTHLAWLTSGRVQPLSLDALMAHPADGPDAVAVTCDDGFRNVGEAAERLLSHDVPVTLFVVTGHIGGTNAWGGRSQPGIPTLPLLDWGAIEQLAARGATIGAHTRTHPVLTALSPTAIDDELHGCLDDLHRHLGCVSPHLAYPYGAVNAAVARRAASHFQFGYTTDLRVMGPADDALWLPRLDMYYWQAPGALDMWGTPRFSRRLTWLRARRSVRARLFGGWGPRSGREHPRTGDGA